MPKTVELVTYIQERIVPNENDCWIWQLSADGYGYGAACYKNRKWRAHRLVYTHYKGEIPEGLVLDHLCNVKICVNPDHLDLTTLFLNSRRGKKPKELMDFCPKGHEYTPENTIVQRKLNRKGERTKTARKCHTCHVEQQRQKFELNREAARAQGRRFYAQHREEQTERKRVAYHKAKAITALNAEERRLEL